MLPGGRLFIGTDHATRPAGSVASRDAVAVSTSLSATRDHTVQATWQWPSVVCVTGFGITVHSTIPVFRCLSSDHRGGRRSFTAPPTTWKPPGPPPLPGTLGDYQCRRPPGRRRLNAGPPRRPQPGLAGFADDRGELRRQPVLVIQDQRPELGVHHVGIECLDLDRPRTGCRASVLTAVHLISPPDGHHESLLMCVCWSRFVIAPETRGRQEDRGKNLGGSEFSATRTAGE